MQRSCCLLCHEAAQVGLDSVPEKVTEPDDVLKIKFSVLSPDLA